jgi:ribosomal protein L11 methylase PrmA
LLSQIWHLSVKEDSKLHWEQVYQTKSPEQVSWTQAVPHMSLDLIRSLQLPKTARIIDIGGGDSTLADHLILEGFVNITVLDISSSALEKAKTRLGDKSKLVKWIVSDITMFEPEETYDLWHDRATFHFLTEENQVATYLNIVEHAVAQCMIIATFSETGPEKCSGLPIKQYSQAQLTGKFKKDFVPVNCGNDIHITPFNTKQNFLFCSFKKRELL